MEARDLKYISAACNGKLEQGAVDHLVSRICTDTRHLQPGDLFIALRGEQFDGHAFVEEAVRRWAAAVMVELDGLVAGTGDCAVIRVANTRAALGRLAWAYQQDFQLPRIAVGGSNGKTTTKELVASVLGERTPVLKSQASFNNDIGVPLTLLNLEQRHGAAVLEVGTNHPGELAPLLRMIRPDYGILASIGREHLEFFGDLDGVVQEEGFLAEILPAGGILYLNGDCAQSARVIERTRARIVRVGLSEGSDWQGVLRGMDGEGTRFEVNSPAHAGHEGEYSIRLLGRHQMVNALFAIAIGAELGLTREEIQRGLARCAPAKMRLQLWRTAGIEVLDDSYNANADSMQAALVTLQALEGTGRKVAVLGDMAELGAHRERAHAEVGRSAAALGVDHLFAVGAMAGVMASAAREEGLEEVSAFHSVDEVASALCEFLRPGDMVLLKASRSTRLERVGERLRNWRMPDPCAAS